MQTISIITLQPGTPLNEVISENHFAEPRLAIFANPRTPDNPQGVIIAEKKVILHIEEFSVRKGLLYLIATYCVLYINYPKSVSASGLLLFIQEVLVGAHEISCKKPAKYTSFLNDVLV